MVRKYEHHFHLQSDRILDCAETLFLEHGIENVSIADVAKAAAVTRATIYNYFADKQAMLWAVFFRNESVLIGSLRSKLEGQATTYQRFEALTRWPFDLEDEYDRFSLYTELFSSIYLKADANDDAIWHSPYNRYGIRPGDTAMMLIRDFHDGSVRSDLDAKQTSVGFLYGVYACASLMIRNRTALPKKYGLDARQVYEAQMQWMLKSIKA